MKALSMIVLSVVLVGGLVGCGKTLTELRTDGDAVIDNSVGFANQTLVEAGMIAKKLIGIGFAVYDIGKKIVEDAKDNVGIVTGGTIGTIPNK